MKKKLQKDLKWLKKLWVRIITALISGYILGFILYKLYPKPDIFGAMKDQYITGCMILIYIGLYFFVAWLYPDEE